MFVYFSYFCPLFSSYEHFSANQYVQGPGKRGRTHWSRSRRDPCILKHVDCAQSFVFRREWISRFPWLQYEMPYTLYVRTSVILMLSIFPS